MSEIQSADEIEFSRREWAVDAVNMAFDGLKLLLLPTLITLVAWPGVERIFVETYLLGTPLYQPLAPVTAPAAAVGAWVGLFWLQWSWIGRHETSI